jgi:hypothetical protein
MRERCRSQPSPQHELGVHGLGAEHAQESALGDDLNVRLDSSRIRPCMSESCQPLPPSANAPVALIAYDAERC